MHGASVVLGVGTDLIEVARIRAAHQRFGDRFLCRILRRDELAYCLRHADPFPFVAARFAAKEAVAKAFGIGMGRQLHWQDLEVKHQPSRQPYLVLHDQALELLRQRQARALHLSLTHTRHYACAVAVLEG